jgi:hypothetical protein
MCSFGDPQPRNPLPLTFRYAVHAPIMRVHLAAGYVGGLSV